MIVSPQGLRAAVSNLTAKLLYGHVADLRPMPAHTVDGGPRRSPLYRHHGPEGLVPAGPPVLFVPSPAAPARCYDLRRGCSLAEHVVNAGRRSYLLDHGLAGTGAAGDDDGTGAVAEWVGQVLPEAIRAVSRDSSGQPVQLVGWCLGGLLSLLATAADPDLLVASVAMIATPATLAGVAAVAAGTRARPRAARAPLLDGRLLRDFQTLANLDRTEYLAQKEAFDHFHAMAAAAYGPSAPRVYSALLRNAATAHGEIRAGGLRIGLGAVRVPVLAIAGRADALAPVNAVQPFTRLLPGAPEVRFEAVPGGHLGALTGHAARTTTWARLDRWLDEGIVRHGIRPHRREAAASL